MSTAGSDPDPSPTTHPPGPAAHPEIWASNTDTITVVIHTWRGTVIGGGGCGACGGPSLLPIEMHSVRGPWRFLLFGTACAAIGPPTPGHGSPSPNASTPTPTMELQRTAARVWNDDCCGFTARRGHRVWVTWVWTRIIGMMCSTLRKVV